MWTYLKYQGKMYDNFLINTNGQVKNLKTGNVYKITYNKKGYAIITLPMGKRGEVKSIRLHRAIAETFIPNPNNYNVVHHKDNNPSNFSLSNLKWVTDRQNVLFSLQERKKETPYFNNRKLTKKEVKEIKENRNKESYNQLAKKYNVSRTTIYNIKKEIFYNNEL